MAPLAQRTFGQVAAHGHVLGLLTQPVGGELVGLTRALGTHQCCMQANPDLPTRLALERLAVAGDGISPAPGCRMKPCLQRIAGRVRSMLLLHRPCDLQCPLKLTAVSHHTDQTLLYIDRVGINRKCLVQSLLCRGVVLGTALHVGQHDQR